MNGRENKICDKYSKNHKHTRMSGKEENSKNKSRNQ